MVIRHTSPISYNVGSLAATYFLVRGTTGARAFRVSAAVCAENMELVSYLFDALCFQSAIPVP